MADPGPLCRPLAFCRVEPSESMTRIEENRKKATAFNPSLCRFYIRIASHFDRKGNGDYEKEKHDEKREEMELRVRRRNKFSPLARRTNSKDPYLCSAEEDVHAEKSSQAITAAITTTEAKWNGRVPRRRRRTRGFFLFFLPPTIQQLQKHQTMASLCFAAGRS